MSAHRTNHDPMRTVVAAAVRYFRVWSKWRRGGPAFVNVWYDALDERRGTVVRAEERKRRRTISTREYK